MSLRVFRYVVIERIDQYERCGWFWDWKTGTMPAPHGHYSVLMEWLCNCPEKTP